MVVKITKITERYFDFLRKVVENIPYELDDDLNYDVELRCRSIIADEDIIVEV